MSETGNHSYSRVLSRTQGSGMGQNKARKKKDYQAQGVGARTRGNSANGAAHHGSGVGKDGDLSRKGLRNQRLEESFT